MPSPAVDRCVAFANLPGKRELFEEAGAAVVIDDMEQLAAALDQSASAH